MRTRGKGLLRIDPGIELAPNRLIVAGKRSTGRLRKPTCKQRSHARPVQRITRHDDQATIHCLLPRDPSFQQAAEHLLPRYNDDVPLGRAGVVVGMNVSLALRDRNISRPEPRFDKQQGSWRQL
ncbi:protein of unknown function (plasmid) [Cupriavidus taiwanensis]|uniref:Transposase n=1 Tax=Cupriavidus taiwanensis TaxID=164546 RepID=A0A7Z7JE14_9BURK|nr:protein of unknown function [Cupriavidus taiwanensis]SOZ42004.1 protein of unknown function [Cupriavidus taiwanensis]SPC21154.1 protein of unknown function [Cupriavidus taiwanensis]SPD55297.1 protein of unknown function [Cupriavidus taiwanensis]